jgi:hypothetical protein
MAPKFQVYRARAGGVKPDPATREPPGWDRRSGEKTQKSSIALGTTVFRRAPNPREIEFARAYIRRRGIFACLASMSLSLHSLSGA